MARPTFQDVSPAELNQLSQPAPRQPAAPPPVPLEDPPIALAPEPGSGDPAEIQPPPNVQRQPADSPPLSSLSKDAKPSKEHDSIEEAFDQAERSAAAEALKTPEQKEQERVAAEVAAKAAEAPPPAPPVETTTTAQTDQTIKDVESELANPNLKPRDRKRYKELLSSLKVERTARGELEAKLKEVADKPVPTAVDAAELEKLRKEAQAAADENMKYRRILQLQDDSEVVKKFDEPVKTAETGITKVLTSYNLGQGTLDLIQKEGGFAAFSKSGKMLTVPVEVDDEANPGQKKVIRIQKSASEITREWLNGMAPADAEAIREGMREQIAAQKQKEQFFQTEGAKAKEYFEEQKKAQAGATEAQQAEAKKIADQYAAWVTETESKTEWLKEQPIASDATPEAKAAAEAHNKHVADTKAFLKNPPKTVQEYQTLVYDAAEARHLRRALPQSQARIKELEAQLARVQGGSTTTPKRGSILPTAPAPSAPKEKKFDPMRDDPAERLAADFARAAGGG